MVGPAGPRVHQFLYGDFCMSKLRGPSTYGLSRSTCDAFARLCPAHLGPFIGWPLSDVSRETRLVSSVLVLLHLTATSTIPVGIKVVHKFLWAWSVFLVVGLWLHFVGSLSMKDSLASRTTSLDYQLVRSMAPWVVAYFFFFYRECFIAS